MLSHREISLPNFAKKQKTRITMKTIFNLLLTTMSAVLMYIPAYAQDYGDPLPIVSGNENGPNENRSPEQSPFYAQVWETYVVLGCTSIIGNADVTLSSTAGDDYETIFNTAFGSIIIPISSNHGFYRLDIELSSGQSFYGEFVL